MRLSDYPYVVHLSFTKCLRRGQYRLARLAEKFEAEITLPWLMGVLAKGCSKRTDVHRQIYDACGAWFDDISGDDRLTSRSR